MAQLVEQLLPIPEARGSNPVIGKIYIEHLFATVNCIEKTKIKKKRSGLTHFFKKRKFSGLLLRCKFNRIPLSK